MTTKFVIMIGEQGSWVGGEARTGTAEMDVAPISIMQPHAESISEKAMLAARDKGRLAETLFGGTVSRVIEDADGRGLCYVDYETLEGDIDELCFVGPTALLGKRVVFHLSSDWRPIDVAYAPDEATLATAVEAALDRVYRPYGKVPVITISRTDAAALDLADEAYAAVSEVRTPVGG